jgi:hypothetical protein
MVEPTPFHRKRDPNAPEVITCKFYDLVPCGNPDCDCIIMTLVDDEGRDRAFVGIKCSEIPELTLALLEHWKKKLAEDLPPEVAQ